MSEPSQSDFKKIGTFIFDVDGVLTDGTLLAFANGEQARAFNIKDGYAIRHAIRQGYRVAVISGKEEAGVRIRLESLDIKEIYLGVEDKLTVFDNYVYYHDIDPATIAYMGDDVPDLEVMLRCGMAACPADAAIDILDISHYVATAEGGKGAVRELIETILKAQHRW
ncbi:HAD-IIIA family hydrolase [soil metagenome]